MNTARKHTFTVLLLLTLVFHDPGNVASGNDRTFTTCYRCTTGLPGAPSLMLQGIVSVSNGTSHGVGSLTWAVSPPINEDLPMRCYFTTQGEEIRLYAAGAKPGAMINLLLVLPNGWGKPGKAHYTWYANNHFGESSEFVPANPCQKEKDSTKPNE